MQFKKATKQQAKLRLAFIGPAGSGKTYSALAVGSRLGSRIAVVDTERGSASKYADVFAFDTLEPDSFSPDTYRDAIKSAASAGYDVLIIDSLSHAWSGKDGALEMADAAARRSSGGNRFAAWREVTPSHNAMVDAIVSAPLHIIVTMRTKTEYVMEENERGKKVPRKIGLQPIQRDGLEYEFDVVADIDLDHVATVSKTRCSALTDKVFRRPGEEMAGILRDWLTDGVAPPPAPPKTEPAPPPDASSSHDPVAALAAEFATCGDMGTYETLCARVAGEVDPGSDRDMLRRLAKEAKARIGGAS